MHLYKYRPWNDFTAEVIAHRRIFFPTKDRLNDPAELIHPVRFQAGIRDEEFDAVRRKIPRRTFALADEIRQRLGYLQSIADDHPKVLDDPILGQYLAMSDEYWRTIEAVYARSAPRDALNYYAMCLFEDACLLYDDQARIVQRLNAKLEQLGILSLSARDDCPVMWSHYAQDHRGVVLIFDTSRDPLLAEAHPVTYQDTRPSHSVDSVVDNLFVKASNWSYEQEYRVLSNPGDAAYEFSPDALVGVILGLRMSDDHRNAVLSLAQADPALTTYVAQSDPTSYAVRSVRVHSP